MHDAHCPETRRPRTYPSATWHAPEAAPPAADQDIAHALAVAARLDRFTIKELAEALALPTHSARYLVQRLERLGTVAAVGERRRHGRRGRTERIYRAVGSEAAQPLSASRPVSAKTINNSLIVLRVSLGHAVEDGLIARNPAASAAGARERIKVAVEQPDMDFLRLSEIPQYLDACSSDYRPLAEVLIACGLRISEALQLSWAHVDFDNSVLLVTGSRKPGQGSVEVRGGTKGDRFRGVGFGPRVKGLLRDLRARQAEHGVGESAARMVFVGADGEPLDRRTISRVDHKHALRDAGLRSSLRLHDLRHIAAASWLAAGLPLLYVQRQLGHASITTTERQYGHLEKSFLRDAARRAEAVIWRDQPAQADQLSAFS